MMEQRQEQEYRRLAKALANAVDDPEAFAIAVDIHRHLGDELSRRAQELTDPALPIEKRFSWRDLAAATGLAKSTLFDVFGKAATRVKRSPLGLVVPTEGAATAKDTADSEAVRRIAAEKDQQAVTDRARKEVS